MADMELVLAVLMLATSVVLMMVAASLWQLARLIDRPQHLSSSPGRQFDMRGWEADLDRPLGPLRSVLAIGVPPLRRLRALPKRRRRRL